MARNPDENTDIITSRWPLPSHGVRVLLPRSAVKLLQTHPVSRDLYPLATGYYPDAHGHRMRRRSHPTHLLIYCTGGSGQLQVGGRSWVITSGDLIVLPAGLGHSYRASAEDPWSIYWVHYDGELGNAYNDLLGAQTVQAIGLQQRLIAEFDALFSLRRAGAATTPYLHGACRLKALLTDIGDMATRSPEDAGRGLDLEQIEELMRLRTGGELNLDELAREASLSKYHFSRKFKALTGHSPIQHFIHLKLRQACRLLDTTDAPVKVIAARLGYDDPYYFSRLFRRVVGLSPRQYRDSHAA